MNVHTTARFVVRPAVDDDGRAISAVYELVDLATGNVVGRDGGEPEDQLLVRDWRWVEEALNNLEEERRGVLAAAGAAPDLLAALRDACDGYCSYCRTTGENNAQESCEATPSCGEREQTWFAAIAKAVGK